MYFALVCLAERIADTTALDLERNGTERRFEMDADTMDGLEWTGRRMNPDLESYALDGGDVERISWLEGTPTACVGAWMGGFLRDDLEGWEWTWDEVQDCRGRWCGVDALGGRSP